jgi:pimeloyl-ACP methyl ester carboxylesterase
MGCDLTQRSPPRINQSDHSTIGNKMNSLTLEISQSTTGSVTSADGTVIGYRQLGSGPGLILVHGGMQASQSFMKLSEALADTFTVYVVDRRGRGMSGTYGDHYSLNKDVEDIQALTNKTGAHYIFGLSSGAVITLQSALMTPALHKVALYEPPLPVNEHDAPDTWVPQFEEDIARGDLAAAMVSVLKGTDDSPMRLIPKFVLVPMLKLGIDDDATETKAGDVSIKALIPTMHYDAQIIQELRGKVERYKDVQADVLLLGGTRSRSYLKTALDFLSTTLPHSKRVEFAGVGHLAADNDGKPEMVAAELKRFFC